jgi:hypothetical protein
LFQAKSPVAMLTNTAKAGTKSKLMADG